MGTGLCAALNPLLPIQCRGSQFIALLRAPQAGR